VGENRIEDILDIFSRSWGIRARWRAKKITEFQYKPQYITLTFRNNKFPPPANMPELIFAKPGQDA